MPTRRLLGTVLSVLLGWPWLVAAEPLQRINITTETQPIGLPGRLNGQFVELVNPLAETTHWVLVAHEPLLGGFEVQWQAYTLNDNQSSASLYLPQRIQVGSQHPDPPSRRPDVLWAVAIELPPLSTTELRWSLQNVGHAQVPVTLITADDYERQRLWRLVSLGAFHGILLLITLYSVLLYFTTQKRFYLFYTVLGVVMNLYFLSSGGLLNLLPGWLPNTWAHRLMLMCIGLHITLVAATPVVLRQRRTNTPPHWRERSLVLGAFVALFTLLQAFTPWYVSMTLPTLGVALIVTLMVTVYYGSLWLRQQRDAFRLVSIAWAIYSLGIILVLSNRLEWLPRNLWTDYGIHVGALSTFSLLYVSLNNQMRRERDRRIAAQQSSIDHLMRFQRLYMNAEEGFVTVTPEGELVDANPAFCRFFDCEHFHELSATGQLDLTLMLKDPEDFDTLRHEVQTQGKMQGREMRLQTAEQRELWMLVLAWRESAPGRGAIKCSFIDITGRKAFEQRLQYLATHDPLTGLLNRRSFLAAIQKAVDEHNSPEGRWGLLCINLDNFRLINTQCGHEQGDQSLAQFATHLQANLPTGSIAARTGADEFAALLPQAENSTAMSIAERLRKQTTDIAFIHQNKPYNFAASIGVTTFLPSKKTADDILARADTACQAAKEQGGNQVHFYTETDADLQRRQTMSAWVSELYSALTDNRFLLTRQTIQPLSFSEPGQHYEVLLRLRLPDGRIAAPGEFLPAAERYGLMEAIDRWVIEHFFQWLHQHPHELTALHRASVNLSGQSLSAPESIRFIRQQFQRYDIPPEKICFEITESMAVTRIDVTQQFIAELRNDGCSFSLDDFGTGYSSYGYLKQLPVQYLKIDGSFVRNMLATASDYAMVKSIHDVAQSMHLQTIAEFVENDELRYALKELGVHFGQGYGISKPELLPDQNSADQYSSSLSRKEIT